MYPAKSHLELLSAILALKDQKKATAFFRDLLTIAELDAAAERWQIAKLLWATNPSYQKIAKKVGASTTTVTRVALWLNNGKGGYQSVLTKMYGKSVSRSS